MMSHDAAWPCTAQRRAVPCRAITHSKQNNFRAENMTMGMEAMREVEGVSMGK